MNIALTIAGSDPTGGAGLQADLKVFRALGVYGLSVPTALTAQNTTGIDLVYDVPNDVLYRQLDFLLGDIRPDALKTGMLYSPEAVQIVAEMIKKYGLRNLVVDPVAVSSSGSPLVKDGTLDAIKATLLPLARMVTPNIYEAFMFTGVDIVLEEDMERAALALKALGPDTVVVTGGHLKDKSLDLFHDGSVVKKLEGEKLEGDFHGTGCAFSSAAAAMLARGSSPLDAVSAAREFVQGAMRQAAAHGKGLRLLNL